MKHNSFWLAVLSLALLCITTEGAGYTYGERLPVMLYTRTGKQTSSKYLKGGKAGYNRKTDETEKPSLAKHEKQIKTALPSVFLPKFGDSRVVVYDLGEDMKAARREMLDKLRSPNSKSKQSELAIRLGVGKGINRETTWLPLVLSQKEYKNVLFPILGERSSLKEGENSPEPEKKASLYRLSKVEFQFGYQSHGDDGYSVTDCKVYYTYDPIEETDKTNFILIHYLWSEHRLYNPHRALTVCAVIVVLWTVVVSMNMLSRRSTVYKYFSRNMISIELPKD